MAEPAGLIYHREGDDASLTRGNTSYVGGSAGALLWAGCA